MTETTSKKKRLRWEGSPHRTPRHPYRDSAILYAILAGVVVGITALTGGNMRAALVVAPMLFVIATAYSWWRWHRRDREEAKSE